MSLISVPLGQEVFLDFTTSSPASGFVEPASSTPTFWVFDNASDSPVVGPLNARQRTGFPGQYNVEFVASVPSGFAAHHFYNVVASGTVENTQGQATIATLFTTNNSIDSVPSTSGIWSYSPRTTTMESGDYAYYADIKFSKNSGSLKDEYTVDWFRNTVPLSSGSVTSPLLTVVSREDGTNLINGSGMSYVSTLLGTTKYDELTNRTVAGNTYVAKTTATIDGSTRTWLKLIGRDS